MSSLAFVVYDYPECFRVLLIFNVSVLIVLIKVIMLKILIRVSYQFQKDCTFSLDFFFLYVQLYIMSHRKAQHSLRI